MKKENRDGPRTELWGLQMRDERGRNATVEEPLLTLPFELK